MIEWIAFAIVIAVLIGTDLFGFQRDATEAPSLSLSAAKTSIYVLVALMFGLWIMADRGVDAAAQFYTGYALEMSLSFDNVFVIGLIFAGLMIPTWAQPRVLFYGIVGAMVLRGIFIGLGTAIVSQFHWVLVLFAVFLIYTGLKMLFGADEAEYDVTQTRTYRFMQRHLPFTSHLRGRKFFAKTTYTTAYPGSSVNLSDMVPQWKFTPLFLALVLVEIADVVFAVDSIPATFAVTTDPYLVFTSNIFAIVGLRSLFFVLQAMVDRFKYLTPALSIVLTFIGGKVLVAQFLNYELPLLWSLCTVLVILTGGVLLSLFKTR